MFEIRLRKAAPVVGGMVTLASVTVCALSPSGAWGSGQEEGGFAHL